MTTLLRITLTGALSLLLCTTGGFAQKEESVSKDKATEYFQKGEWANAVKAFEMITEEQPNNIGAWFQMGFALHSLKKYDKAIAAYNNVLNAGPTAIGPLTMYNVACAYALKGESEVAFEWLSKSTEAGFNQVAQIKGDADLVALQSDKRFAAIVEQVDKNARPCAYNEKARELDFWVGDWNVYNQVGQLAGTNTIQNLLQDCVIHEQWSSPFTGFNGQSFSTYDPTIEKWRQTWVDNKGTTNLFVGEVVDGSMVFERESTDPEGNVTITQMIVTPMEDGKVHQVGQSSSDGGETWTVNYDLTYVQKEEDGSDSGS